MQDEGIVQPISKEMDRLSRRLHHLLPPAAKPGAQDVGFLSPAMMNQRSPARLDTADAAYIGGLIDGEGTITLSRRHACENRQLVVSISSTEKPILAYVLSKVGAGKITSKRIARTHHSPSFTYSIANRQALDLIGQVAPYLRSYKKKRAFHILRDYVRLTPRNGKYSEQVRLERTEFENTVLGIRSRS